MVCQASALARVGPLVIFLQAQRSYAIFSFIPIASMSLLTLLLQVFLGAPLSATPVTFILVHFFTQSFSFFRSTCPLGQKFKMVIVLPGGYCSQLFRPLYLLFNFIYFLKDWQEDESSTAESAELITGTGGEISN